jgi:hypothetical protein
MTPMQRAVLVAGAAGSLLAGGVIGATLAGPLAATASNGNGSANQAGSTSNGGGNYGFLAAASAAPSAGTFKSNEDATHEKGETAAQEAAENSGQRPSGGKFGPGGSNESAAHEQGESAAREAQEDAAKAAAPTSPSVAPSTQ